jgi:hypothetical protein
MVTRKWNKDEETKRVNSDIENKIFKIIYIVIGIFIFFDFKRQNRLFKR